MKKSHRMIFETALMLAACVGDNTLYVPRKRGSGRTTLTPRPMTEVEKAIHKMECEAYERHLDNQLKWFTIHGITIWANSRKDAIKKYNRLNKRKWRRK